jgi:hypothetical protein
MEKLQARIAILSAEVEDANRRLEFPALNPDLDDDNDSTAIYWDTYFGPGKDRFYAKKSEPDLEPLIATRTFSTGHTTLTSLDCWRGRRGSNSRPPA